MPVNLNNSFPFCRGMPYLVIAIALIAGTPAIGQTGTDAIPQTARVDGATGVGMRPIDRLQATASIVEQSAAKLRKSVENARLRLSASDPQTSAAWQQYLRFSDLELIEQLSPSEVTLILHDVLARLRGDYEGLETDELVQLRNSVKAHLRTLRAIAALESGSVVRNGRELLNSALASPAAPDPDLADRIGAAVETLETLQLSPELVVAARARWTFPNAVVYVGTDFAAKYVVRNFAEAGMQRLIVLGTQTRGIASTRGALELLTIPNDRTAELQLRLSGTSNAARVVGHNGPATIYTSAGSRFTATKTLTFDPNLGLTAEPSRAAVNTSIGIRDIDVEPRILPTLLQPVVNRAAWNRANETHDAAEREVARQTRTRIEQRLEQETFDYIDHAQRFYRKYVVTRGLRLDELPTVTARTTEDSIEVQFRQAQRHQLAAAGPAPEMPAETQVGVALHQSLFCNTSCRTLWGDGLVTDELIESYSQFATGQVPPALRVFSNSTPWSVVLDSERPNRMIFDDGRIDLTARTLAWTIGDVTYDRAVDVRVVYQVENSKLGMTFTRVGDIQIAPTDGKPWTAVEAEKLLPHIREKCAAMFQEQGRFNSLILPRGDGFGPLGTIELKQVRCDDGWLVIAYQ